MAKKSKRVAAEYIAGMCHELADLAEQKGFQLGSYLLKMACLEFVKQHDQLNKRPAGRSST
jgi:hypothetical protein